MRHSFGDAHELPHSGARSRASSRSAGRTTVPAVGASAEAVRVRYPRIASERLEIIGIRTEVPFASGRRRYSGNVQRAETYVHLTDLAKRKPETCCSRSSQEELSRDVILPSGDSAYG